MRYLDEFRDAELVGRLAKEIVERTTKPWRVMEICGGQTHAIMRFGIDRLLPETIDLVHGPGCPVCVTPIEIIDKALLLASRPDVVFCSFGDMLRVPGSSGDLSSVKAAGGDIRIVYSPLDSVRVARENPETEVVFFAIGFETTAPANAMAVLHASREGIHNFSILVSQFRVPPAIEAILSSPQCAVDGFLAAGHVCAVMGTEEYAPIAAKYSVPIVVTGFEPVDILRGISACIRQLEQGRSEVENAYSRTVKDRGNRKARETIDRVFRITSGNWRGIGEIPASGLGLRDDYVEFDAEKRFQLSECEAREPSECMSGLVLQGILKPDECPEFGGKCTPQHPLGATMVSSEGACAAYHQYRTSQRDGFPR